MGRYNSFYFDSECTFCGTRELRDFQAEIGVLEWDNYEPCDKILWKAHTSRVPYIGPRWEKPEGSFWATGIARCTHCQEDLIGRVLIRNNRFVGVEFPDVPDGLYDWGTLPE